MKDYHTEQRQAWLASTKPRGNGNIRRAFSQIIFGLGLGVFIGECYKVLSVLFR